MLCLALRAGERDLRVNCRVIWYQFPDATILKPLNRRGLLQLQRRRSLLRARRCVANRNKRPNRNRNKKFTSLNLDLVVVDVLQDIHRRQRRLLLQGLDELRPLRSAIPRPESVSQRRLRPRHRPGPLRCRAQPRDDAHVITTAQPPNHNLRPNDVWEDVHRRQRGLLLQDMRHKRAYLGAVPRVESTAE